VKFQIYSKYIQWYANIHKTKLLYYLTLKYRNIIIINKEYNLIMQFLIKNNDKILIL